jgi:WD40 repeat protein
MTIQKFSLLNNPGAADWGTVVCAFLPREDRDRFATLCHCAQTIFRNSLQDYYKRFLHHPAEPLPRSLLAASYLTQVRRSRAIASPNNGAIPFSQILNKNEQHITRLWMNPDRTQLFAAFADNTFKIWNETTEVCLSGSTGQTGIHKLAISCDGTKLFFTTDHHTICIWDLTTETFLHTLTGHSSSIHLLHISLDGKILCSADASGIINVWDLMTGTCLHTFTSLQGHWIHYLRIHSNGTKLFSASDWGYTSPTIKIWDLMRGTCLHTLTGHTSVIRALQMSRDETKLVSAALNGEVKVWDPVTGACLQTFTDPENSGSCMKRPCQLSPDGTKLVFGSGLKNIKVWDLMTGTCLHTLTGHTRFVHKLRIDNNGTKIFSASPDNTIKIWNLATGTCLQTLIEHTDSICALEISLSGDRLFSGSRDHTIRMWMLNALPEERITAVSLVGKISQEAFNSIPQFARAQIFYLTTLIHRQRHKIPRELLIKNGKQAFVRPLRLDMSKMPKTAAQSSCYISALFKDLTRYALDCVVPLGMEIVLGPYEYGERAFLDQQGCTSTQEEKQLALDLYSAKFFLPAFAEIFTELADRDMNPQERELLIAEAKQYSNRFSTSLIDKVYDTVLRNRAQAGKLPEGTPLNNQETATREIAEAMQQVYTVLLYGPTTAPQ